MTAPPQDAELWTPAEVARALRVDPRTITHWAQEGKIRCIRTPGNHRRYFAADIRALLDGRRGGIMSGWISQLACGHQAESPGQPRLSGWITCPACQSQRKVLSTEQAKAS